MGVVKQIKCPPNNKKKDIKTALKTWFKTLELYGFDYTGAGQILGTTSNKKKRKTTIGINKFYEVPNVKCGTNSCEECINKQKYIYVKGYPLGKIHDCNNKNTPIPGGTGIIGSIFEDLYNLNGTDHVKAIFGKGPYGTTKCMSATLPVGNSFLDPSKKIDPLNVDPEKLESKSWWVETKCVPYQTTHKIKYADQVFNFPFDDCNKSTNECFKNFDINRKYKIYLICIILFTILLLFFYYTIN